MLTRTSRDDDDDDDHDTLLRFANSHPFFLFL